MSIVEQHFEEEKIATNSTVFIRSKIEKDEKLPSPNSTFLESMKWPLIGSLSAILLLILMGLGYISQLSRSSKEGVKLKNDVKVGSQDRVSILRIN